ncbi:MAG: hypothetical protein ACN6QT_36405 [Burkholderia contaminans]|uniref:Uncharacterized protein n=1 Tax=Burkholderia contaminans TaxID=488447 RepID=A0AAP4VGA0_9BURK|nr:MULTISPECIES: hypothetical protein [Burkholderia]MBD1410536.1 hypothetical protein [Burkholderia contaminans]MBM6427376.1 hypothetical protein [Burkholderia contaminans]MCA7875647.1 hypothetical protein [Burkholderia contaminans]MDN7564347.1 hypothetical protein [Burkholderia contaminans]MDN8024098.1 hypothetical protein [Burkholderia contaminans]
MKKILSGLLALVCSTAFAQNYPSPTYNNLTVQGTATLTNHPLAVSSGGTNSATASGTALDNITGFSSTGFLTRTGAGAYSFQSLTNGIALSNIAQIAANTLLGNATGSTANVTAVAVTGCNGTAQALQWTNGSGFQCNSNIATSGANANITSLSGLTTALSVSQGGTGRQTLTSHGVLVGEGAAAINQLAVGTTGQVLVGATGADPAFGTTVAGLTFTSALTPQTTGGIVGTTLADNANAGSVGEFLSASVPSGSAIALTSTTPANVTSVLLSAGDWDCRGSIAYAVSAGAASMQAGINTVSATIPAANTTGSMSSISLASGNFGTTTLAIAPGRFNVSSSTTVYLVANATFASGTVSAYGFLGCRRVR